MIKRQLLKFVPFFQSAVVVLIASLFVISIVYAATTIGSNITTGGNLAVTGTASSTSATTSAYLMVGYDANDFSALSSLFDYDQDLAVAGNIFATRVTSTSATSSDYFMVGDLSVSYLDYAGGDLYVADDVEIDGSATTTSLYLDDDIRILGNASTTGDILVQGGTIDLSTSTPTTTPGIFSRDLSIATSTISVGNVNKGAGNNAEGASAGCLEMVREGAYYQCWITTAGTGIECTAGRCGDCATGGRCGGGI